VERFVLISTDKAVRPTNVMGASKRMAELVLQAMAERDGSTVFCMVRFGNVLGSSGSVVPVFREQIRSGGPVMVTHPDMTRYFMTIPEAAALVIQAGSMGLGGDVFVLDMGEPVKIIDLARQMIHLSGYQVRNKANPHGDVQIQFSGLRPGEKLYEELLIGDEVSGTSHSRIMRAMESKLSWEETEALLGRLEAAVEQLDSSEVHAVLKQAVPEFVSDGPVVDSLWKVSTLMLARVKENKVSYLPHSSETLKH
jgi:FlaA1/EpsC-like NDP-sugar epimerase